MRMCDFRDSYDDMDGWALRLMQDELRQRKNDPEASFRDAHGYPSATPTGEASFARAA